MPTPRVLTTTLTDEIALSIDFMLEGLHDQVRDATPRLSWMLGTLGQEIRKTNGRSFPDRLNGTLKKFYPGGPSIDVTVQVSKGQPSKEIVGLQKEPVVEEQLLTLARNPYAFIGRGLTISTEDIRVASATTAAKVDLIESRVNNLKQAQIEKLNSGLNSSGAGVTNSIRGFGDLFTSTTYAELDPTVFTTWLANLDTAPGSFALNGEQKMNKMINDLTINNSRPSIIFMDGGMIERFDKSISSRVFFESGPAANVGFVTRTFQQIPVVMDKTMPADTIDFLNDEFLYLYVHKDSDNTVSPATRLQDAHGIVRDIEWMGQLICKSRRHQGRSSGWTA